MQDVDAINEKLLLYYGRELDGRPRYRVVWSTNQLEKRKGEFNEFYGSIYLRTFYGVKEVPKYPFDRDRWIVEKLFYINNPELFSNRPGSYEPVYVLKGPNGEFLPLNWRAVDMVVSFAEKKPVGIKLTDADFSDMEQKEMDEDTEYFREVLADQGRSPLFAFEESVFVDSTRRFQ